MLTAPWKAWNILRLLASQAVIGCGRTIDVTIEFVKRHY